MKPPTRDRITDVSAASVASVVTSLADSYRVYGTREEHLQGALNAVAWSFWSPVLDATADDFPDPRANEVAAQMHAITDRAAADIEALLRSAD